MNSRPSSLTALWQTKVPERMRAAVYNLPLFVLWVVGISIESQETPYKAARRSMFLSLVFLGLTGLFYFSHGFFRYFSPTTALISGYLFFGLQSLNVAAYIIISLWQAWQALQQGPAPITIVEKNSGRMESFLSR